MKKKASNLTKVLLKVFHKFDRYTIQQKFFIFYLFVLIFFVLFFPIIKIKYLDSENTKYIFLLSFGLVKSAIFLFLSLAFLLVWNLSYRFKNFVINVFGFRDNDLLLNFALLLIIGIGYLGIGDGVNVSNNITSTITLTISYYIVQILIVVGLILTLWYLVKHVNKEHNVKIINIVDEKASEKAQKTEVKTLFDD